MKNDFTRRNHSLDSRAVKVKFAGAGYALLAAVWLCMALLAPQPLSAADDVGNAKQAVGHQLYFGNFPQTYTGRIGAVTVPAVPYVLKTNIRDLDEHLDPYTGYFLVEPVQWRVLADDAEGILLLSEFNLANWAYNTGGTTSWESSSVRDSLKNRFLLGGTTLGGTKAYFSPIEIGAIKPSVLQNPKLGQDIDGIPTTDSVFLLADVDSTLFASAADRIAKNTAYAASHTNTSGLNEDDVWLLRTHSASFFAGYTMYVREESGHVDRYGLANILPSLIRPALRLSRDRFVMLSNSKPPKGSVGNPLTSAPDIMKLTLVDPTITGWSVTPGGNYISLTEPNLTLPCSVTIPLASNEYISVLVEELGGGVLYYSKLLESSDPLPSSLTVIFDGSGSYPPVPAGTYTVKIFREQINASPSEPDLASVPKVFTVGIASSPAPAAIITEEGTADDLSDGWVNVYYNDTVNFTGAPLPVLSVTGLPPGLTLEPDGTLHGTPTATSPYPYHITVTANNGGIPVSREYDVEIRPSSAPVISYPDAGLIDSVLRGATEITVDTVRATGAPAPTFSVSSGLLPDGMKLDSVTGRIYGAPSKEQYATFTVKASNPLGDDYREYNIKVKLANNPIAPLFTTVALPVAYATLPYSFQIEASGEPAPTFLALSGLPSGLMLDPGTGEISGKPVPNSYLASPYTVKIRMSNGVTVTQDFPMVVNATLPPPHLELTTATPTVGTDPFEVTAKFDLPVSDLQLLTEIKVTNGTASNLQMVNPTATVPPRATVWTFDVTPDASISNGTVIEACIPTGAALSEEGAHTYADSDTARVAFQSDQPLVQFNTVSGQSFVENPGTFWFDVFPNGTAPNANSVYMNGAPASDANIGNAIEIRRDGALYDEWEATVSGVRVTVTGVFRQGSYDVILKPNSLGNNVGKFTVQTVFQFSVQLSTSWCEGCPQTFTQTYTPLGVDRTVTLAYDGALAGYLTGIDGDAAPASVPLPAVETDVTLSFRTLAVPDELEGDSVTITVTDPGTSRVDKFQVKLYNRPKAEDVVYIPATTRYPGYFKLVKGGSPDLLRSFDAGQHWSNAWETATGLELSDAGEEIILREPDGCYSLVIPLDVSISATIQRSIHLSGTANIVTLPGTGEHSVFSGADFAFRVTMNGPLAGHRPLVTTDRQHVPDSVGTVVELNDDGSFTVTLRAVREPVHVTLAAGELLTGNADVEGTQVWASDGQLYISSVTNGEAKVYTLTGALLKSVPVAAGQTVRTGLPPGFFVVKPGDGRTFKVSGF